MGIDLSLTKGYGFTVPLAAHEEIYRELHETFYEKYPHFDFGISGSYSMSGEPKKDVIWITPSRLVVSEDPKASSGFIWRFTDELSTLEKEGLRAIARDLFQLEDPKFEPFVAMMVF